MAILFTIIKDSTCNNKKKKAKKGAIDQLPKLSINLQQNTAGMLRFPTLKNLMCMRYQKHLKSDSHLPKKFALFA